MCGRFVQYSDPEIYARTFDLDALPAASPRYNLAPTQPVLAIRKTAEGTRALVPLRWGLVPAWSKGPDSRYSMINARAETVDTKPAYRNAFKHRRCLIPSEGFYEWKATGKTKTPFLIRRTMRRRLRWRDSGRRGTARTRDHRLLHHHRDRRERAGACAPRPHAGHPLTRGLRGLARPREQGHEGLRALLRPVEPDGWNLVEVSRRVNSPRNDSPDLIEPVAA